MVRAGVGRRRPGNPLARAASGVGGERARRPRYSMPFFLHFNSDFPIATLPACVGPDRPDRYPDAILADDYLRQRLREIKLLY